MSSCPPCGRACLKGIILGNVGRDPETRDLPGGDKVANFSVAVSRKWTDKGGQKREETTWFRVACFGKLGEIAQQYVRKGGQVMVSGRISARAYVDNNNQPAVSLDLNADQLQLLGGKAKSSGGSKIRWGQANRENIPF